MQAPRTWTRAGTGSDNTETAKAVMGITSMNSTP